jgi:hypothetical protein
MEQHVLLVVHHQAAGAIAFRTGTIAKTGPPATSSVAAAYACIAASVTSYAYSLPARPIAARSKVAALVSGTRFRLPDKRILVHNPLDIIYRFP